jgi:hypothetical protein
MSVKQELNGAKQAEPSYWLHAAPSLHLRMKLGQFALDNNLENETEAILIVASRYFRMVESDEFSSWFNKE